MQTRRSKSFCSYTGLFRVGSFAKWLRGLDLNQGPLGYEPNELPDCSTPHLDSNNRRAQGQTALWRGLLPILGAVNHTFLASARGGFSHSAKAVGRGNAYSG